jgi:hypothetical protein
MASNGENLEKISQKIQKWIRKQENVKEESITDWLLYQMGERISNITSLTFSHHEEARVTGADWEWWFIYPHRNYKFRVQAKRIIPTRSIYQALNYKKGEQIELLIKDALKNNSIPLYALYTNSVSKSRCPKDIKNEGVYLAGALELKENIIDTEKKRVTFNELFERSIPLSCILCCELIPKNIESFLKKYFLANARTEIIYKKDSHLGEHKTLPMYIKAIINSTDEISAEYIQQQYSNEVNGISAITIIDFSNKQY